MSETRKAKRLTPKQKRQRVVERLMAAMNRCATLRGEAQWTNGYRTGKPAEEARLYEKEMRQWQADGRAENAFRRLAVRVLREATL